MFNGIAISDTRLLVWSIFFSIALLVIIGISIVACISFYDKENTKNAKRIKALREQALTDPTAEKRLQKLERMHKRKFKNVMLDKIITLLLVTILFFVDLFVGVIPGWTDYIKKDYVIYEGNSVLENGFNVKRYTRSSYITLADGTRLTGSLGLDDGEYKGRIVYAKRTKIALGFEENK